MENLITAIALTGGFELWRPHAPSSMGLANFRYWSGHYRDYFLLIHTSWIEGRLVVRPLR